MKTTRNIPAVWSAIRKYLATLEKPALLALLKDLYDVGADNRDFLQARCQAKKSGVGSLQGYRDKIVEQFFPMDGFGKLNLGQARKAIRDYRKATGSQPGTAELLMCYVENGAEFTQQYGDIHERFYNSIESALDELATLLRKEPALYPPFAARLARVEHLTKDIGWGFHDHISDVVGGLKDDFSGS